MSSSKYIPLFLFFSSNIREVKFRDSTDGQKKFSDLWLNQVSFNMKRLEHFPENIFSIKMIDVPAEWQDRRTIWKPLCLMEKRKEGRQEGKREGNRKIYGTFSYQHTWVLMYKKLLLFFFNNNFIRHYFFFEVAIGMCSMFC